MKMILNSEWVHQNKINVKIAIYIIAIYAGNIWELLPTTVVNIKFVNPALKNIQINVKVVINMIYNWNKSIVETVVVITSVFVENVFVVIVRNDYVKNIRYFVMNVKEFYVGAAL